MLVTMTNKFEAANWDEHNYVETEDGGKLALVKVNYKYGGQIEGETESRSLLTYLADGSGTFVGTELFTGTIEGKKGTVVFQHAGTFDAEHIVDNWTLAPGTGTGELEGATGTGSFDMKMGTPSVEYTFTT
ncbi:uncharacterized protein DUF3224 [Actinocrispum wychmicini]|uniref:Uncharacterized protein DUF3224 n=2 Tax=Actinocrispum wychmicini TaxID=1213861 RepID=A0A4R2K5N3_9PSEU|nr:uncharacterized protein DUF3224 [Actinocrispum wychmicini]